MHLWVRNTYVYLATMMRRGRKFSFLTSNISRGGICDPFTPDTEIECDKKRLDSQKNVMDGVVDGGGMGTEQFERHISH